MDATSRSRAEDPPRVALRDSFELQESRLWDRARSNLMLLYGGRKGVFNPTRVNPAGVATARFGVIDL